MGDISYRVLDQFPQPAHAALVDEAFADHEPSAALADVAREEQAARAHRPDPPEAGALRIGAFRGDALVGWTYATPQGATLLMMANSGVAATERRRGIYSELARRMMALAREQGYAVIQSRHAVGNNAVIIAKLRLGFVVSGFEYSEVYGPLVRLTCLLGAGRQRLYQARARPLRRAP